MKWYSYLICFICVFAGVFSIINLVPIWNEKTANYGNISSIETENGYEDVAKFDYGVIQFETDDNVTYVNSQSFAPVKFDGSSFNFAVLFNDELLSNVTIYSGRIEASYTRNFYDTDGSIICSATMNFNIDFYDDSTQIAISHINENDSIVYLTRYMTINGAILKVVEKE